MKSKKSQWGYPSLFSKGGKKMKLFKIPKKMKKRRRGIIPVLAIFLLALIPVGIYLAWLLVKKVEEKL